MTNANTSKKMLERDPFIVALFANESRTATHCVSALEDGDEPARVWCTNIAHAEQVAAILPKYGFTDVEIEEA